MKLLFVHEVNWRRKVVFEIHDFPELLSLRGHEVVFVDFPEGESRRGFRRFLDLKTEVYFDQSRAHEGSSVEVRTPGRVFPSPFDRLFASITQVPAIWRALRDEQFDAVVLYGVPTNGWQAVRIAKHFGVPVLLRAVDVSHALRKSLFKPLIKLAEHSVYKRASWISTNNVALRDYILEHGADPERISVDYAGLDFDRFHKGDKDPALLDRYGLSERDQIVLFMGTFYRFAGLDWFIEKFADHLRSDPDVKLVLIGGGEHESELRTLVDRLDLGSSIVFTGFVKYHELADHLRLADVGIAPFLPQLATDCGLVTKVLQYVASGVVTVCTPLLGTRRLLGEGEGVLYRNPGAAYVDEVTHLLASAADRSRTAIAGHSRLVEQCSWAVNLEVMEARIAASGDDGSHS
jgi:glycosyltransferase involved in cell wall biosynthesis